MHDRLYRSRQNRIIGGVAAGLGEYLNLDPVLIRILFVIVTLLNGLGIVIYIIFWIIVPENDYEQPEVVSSTSSTATDVESPSNYRSETKVKQNKKSGNGRIIAGIILIILGFSFLSERFFPFFDFDDILPLFLLVAGIGLIWTSVKNNRNSHEKQ